MNKNYRMAKFININGKYVPYTNDTDLMKLQSEEIERLNNIINELEKGLNSFNIKGLIESNNREVAMVIDALKERLKELKEGK